MDLNSAGAIIFASERTLTTPISAVAAALATPTSEETARLVPIFGPTVAGEESFVDALGLDLSRALLGEISYTWNRPFRIDETVRVSVRIDEVFDRGTNRFGVVVAEFTDDEGDLIQRQRVTFIERQAS